MAVLIFEQMEFLDQKITDYAELYTTPESSTLKSLNRETWAGVMMPRMLSGHMQGRFLSMISQMIRPFSILEIGTYTGYSALCMAEGLRDGGMIHTIDNNEELEDMVQKYIQEAGLTENIKQYIGNALQVIPQIISTFDLVFIDADKENYVNYYKLVFDKVRTGGFIVADNVLWSGKVLDPKELSKDKETQAIHAFNEMVMKDDRVENVLLPIRDGLMVVRKK